MMSLFVAKHPSGVKNWKSQRRHVPSADPEATRLNRWETAMTLMSEE